MVWNAAHSACVNDVAVSTVMFVAQPAKLFLAANL